MLNTNFLQIIQQSDYLRMPWKNGLGETREIQRFEDNTGLRFRISQASVVDNGVFSDFSGMHRTLVLLSGEGMILDHQGKDAPRYSHNLTQSLDIARFSGGDKTHATLIQGTIEDLNIMVRDADTHARVIAEFGPTILAVSDKNKLFTGFYANQKTAINYYCGQSEQMETLFLPSQSLLVVDSCHSDFNELKLLEGSGVLIQIERK